MHWMMMMMMMNLGLIIVAGFA